MNKQKIKPITAYVPPSAGHPNDDHVICPNCVNQFRAVPVNVQKLLNDAGYCAPYYGKEKEAGNG